MNQRTFTLIELLAVMGIIVILAALVVGGAGLARRKAAEAKTVARMKKIELALEQYRSTMGYFPQDGSYSDLLKSIAKVPKAREMLDDWGGTDYNDGFHQPFRYICPGTHNKKQYDLWSIGPDGAPGTSDDITNWGQQ